MLSKHLQARAALLKHENMNENTILSHNVEWRVADMLTPYESALEDMLARQAAIHEGRADELVWLLEHPPLYTAGTSANIADLRAPQFPVFETGRGGKYTYHGPGQRVGYLMLNLNKRGKDVRCFVHHLEGWVIDALAEFGVSARRAEGRIGIWVDDPQGREAKIGAIGVRIKRWITAHGFSVNINPDLSHFGGIVPCGLAEFPVTSLAALGINARITDFDQALKKTFPAFIQKLAACAQNCETQI